MMKRSAIKRHVWALPFEMVMALSVPVFAWTGQLGYALAALGLAVACALPIMVERIWQIRFAPVLHGMYASFLFVSIYAAELFDMYGKFAPWDDGVHIISGLLVGLASALWIDNLSRRQVIRVPGWLQVGMVIAIGALVAVMWELIEFTSDHVLGTFMQRADLVDTMTDLAYGLLGALAVAVLFGRFLRQRRSFGVGRIIAQQRRLND